MIYLFCPLHAEALPVIRNLHLVRQESLASFVCYGDNVSWFLTVCGTGKVACAAAVGAVLSKCDVSLNDVVVLYGSAAGVLDAENDRLYNGVKLIDMHSGQDGYPDVVTKNSPLPAMIVSGDVLYDGGWPFAFSKESVHLPLLYDIESAAFFKAAMLFCNAHQIAVLRYVSDKGNVISKDDLYSCSSRCAAEAVSYMERMQKRIVLPKEKDFSEEAGWLNELFHGSVTMKNQCRQIISWCELSSVDWKKEVKRMQEEGILPARDKEEGKKILHEFKKRICG